MLSTQRHVLLPRRLLSTLRAEVRWTSWQAGGSVSPRSGTRVRRAISKHVLRLKSSFVNFTFQQKRLADSSSKHRKYYSARGE